MPSGILTSEKRRPPRPVSRRARRVEINAAAWFVGSLLISVLWVLNQWRAHGSFEHFGSHSGNPGDWNPTLWALSIGLWGLIVGIMALRVHFERQSRRFRFHVAAFLLGIGVLTPLWALLEWQDNGGFKRWSANGRPGDWEPWILYVGGIWALVIALLMLRRRVHRPGTRLAP